MIGYDWLKNMLATGNLEQGGELECNEGRTCGVVLFVIDALWDCGKRV
jgi:hypothetical protein